MEEEELKIKIVDSSAPSPNIKDGVPSEVEDKKPKDTGAPKIVDSKGYINPDMDNVHEGLDVEDYKGYLGNDIFVPTGGIEAMNTQRANNQSWYAQAGNMVGQAVVGEIIGGTIEGLGYLLDVGSAIDYASGNETEWGNFLSDAGKDLRTWGQDNMAIHQTKEGSFNPSDSGWWFGNGVSVASSLSMLIPSGAATKALGLIGKSGSKVAGTISKSLDIAARMGKKEKWMAKGVTQAIVSRHIENSMEASGTFESARNEYLNQIDPETGTAFSEEKATRLASEAAASNYRLGWAMLLQDIPQYLAIGKIFNPKTMRMENALNKAAKSGKKIKLKPWQQKVAAGAGTFGSEGFEESYQYFIAERGRLLSDLKAGLISEEEYDTKLKGKLGDEEMMTSAFWGGLGGNLFQAAGPAAQNLFKSKERKDWDKNYATKQGDFLKKRGDSFSVLQKEIAAADEANDPLRREKAINEMMLVSTVEAIELDRFDEHMESLANMTNMSEEERIAFEESQGIELNAELFKKYIPEITRAAQEVRRDYLKHLNKNDRGIAASLAMDDAHIRSFGATRSVLATKIADVKKKTLGMEHLSNTLRKKLELDNKRKAIQTANLVHENNSVNSSDRVKANVKKIIDSNNKTLKRLEKEYEDLSKDNKLSSSEKEFDAEYKAGAEIAMEEILEMEIEDTILGNAIQLRQVEKKYKTSEKFKKESKLNTYKASVESLTSKDDVAKAKSNLENSDFDDADKKTIRELLKKKEAAIIREQAIAEAKAKAASHAADLAAKAKASQATNPKVVPNTNAAPIEDGVEDSNQDEEINFNDIVAASDDATVETKAESERSLSLLDKVPGTEGFQQWKANMKNKIGTEVSITHAPLYEGINPDEAKAIADFLEARASGSEATQSMYDNLPLKVEVNPSVFTFLPTKNAKAEFYDTNYAPQRKIIIDKLIANEEVITNISYTSGGELVSDYDIENEVVPEHSVLDLKQINSIDDVELLVTNRDGQMMDLDKKINVQYAGELFTVGSNKTASGKPKPYRGGLFLNVKKADGSKFPLKLNFLKNTPAQAEMLSELMSEIYIKKTIAESNPLSTFDEEIRSKIKNVFGPELKVLGKDPKAEDIVQMFVYLNSKTKSLMSELYVDKGRIMFGEGKSVSLEDVNDLSELTEFLTNTKRRQFNLRLNRDFPKYKRFILENNIVNTNATITEDLFQSTRRWENGKMVGRRIGTWIAPIAKPVDNTIQIQTGEKSIPAELQLRINKTKELGVKLNDDTRAEAGKYYTYYFGVKKKGSVISANRKIEANTIEAVQAKVEKKYADEIDKLPTQKKVQIPHTKPTPVENDPGIPNNVATKSNEDKDVFFDKALKVVLESNQASASLIQRKLGIGYNRAERIMDQLEAAGHVSGMNGAKGRSVISNNSNQSEIDKIEAEREAELNEFNDSIPWATDESDLELDQINAKYDAKIAEITAKPVIPEISNKKEIIAIPSRSKENKEKSIIASEKLNKLYEDTEINLKSEKGDSFRINRITDTPGFSDYYAKTQVPIGVYFDYKIKNNQYHDQILMDFSPKENKDGTYTFRGTIKLNDNTDISSFVSVDVKGPALDSFLEKRKKAEQARAEYRRIGFKDINDAMRGVDANQSTAKASLNGILNKELVKMMSTSPKVTPVEKKVVSSPKVKPKIDLSGIKMPDMSGAVDPKLKKKDIFASSGRQRANVNLFANKAKTVEDNEPGKINKDCSNKN